MCICKVELKELLPNLQPCKHLCETSAFKNFKNIPSCRSQNTRYQHQKPHKNHQKSSPEPILLSTQNLENGEKQLICSSLHPQLHQLVLGDFQLPQGEKGLNPAYSLEVSTAKAPENKPGPNKESNLPVPSFFRSYVYVKLRGCTKVPWFEGLWNFEEVTLGFSVEFFGSLVFLLGNEKTQGKTKSFEKRPGKKFTGFFGKSGVL